MENVTEVPFLRRAKDGSMADDFLNRFEAMIADSLTPSLKRF